MGGYRKEPPGRLKYEELVREAVSRESYLNGVGVVEDPLPHPNDARVVLENHFRIRSDRNFRVILVEDYGNYKVFIQVPGRKSDYDFYVWRAVFRPGGFIDVKVPAHDDLASMYSELKSKHEDVREYLINAVVKLIHPEYRWGVPRIVSRYFSNLEDKLKEEISKFLSTLKWIALQEDCNYPPSEGKMGSKYTLAVYALLEAGFTIDEIRRVIRF